jgi:hypothetical protein
MAPELLDYPEAEMTEHIAPELDPELLKRINIVRRDLGNLLFHFTRMPNESSLRLLPNMKAYPCQLQQGQCLKKYSMKDNF